MKNVPATMAIRHPDNATSTGWNNEGLMSFQDELEECYQAFSRLECSEFLWSWNKACSGKAAIEQLLEGEGHADLFREKKLGKHLFISFSFPDSWFVNRYKLAQAYLDIVSLKADIIDKGYGKLPEFDVVVSAEDIHVKLEVLKNIFKGVQMFAASKHNKGKHNKGKQDSGGIKLIPSLDNMSQLLSAGDLLNKFFKNQIEILNVQPDCLRPFILRSEVAVEAGMVAATIASKLVISECCVLQDELKIPICPIIDVGGLPFRGGLNPGSVDHFLAQYKGIQTVTIPSSFRFDYPTGEAALAVEVLNEELKNQQGDVYDGDMVDIGRSLIEDFGNFYKDTIVQMRDKVNSLLPFVPKRYSGSSAAHLVKGGEELPDAIQFSAVLYSIGVPPEIIGAGRGLKEAMKQGKLDELLYIYPGFKDDIIHAGHFLNMENLDILTAQEPVWKEIKLDIMLLENLLDIELGPKEIPHYVHRNLTSTIFLLWENKEGVFSQFIDAAVIRKSIG